MKTRSLLFALVVATLPLHSSTLHAQWPQFRGPDGTGISSSADLPLTWGEAKNVRWKTPVHGRAWSSPVVLGNQIWVTTATEDGRELFAVALDRDSGKILFDLKLFQVAKPQYAHPFNTYASPTPVIEPGRVYVTFGSPGTAAIDTKTGKVIWERRDFECNHFRGAGSSPIIFGDLLLMHFDGSDHQFVVGLDKRTGKTVWRTERSVDFQDLDAGREAEGRRRFSQGFRDATDCDGRRTPGDGEHRIESDLRVRSADRQGALEGHRARQPLARRAAGSRARPRVCADWGLTRRSSSRFGPTARGMSRPRTSPGASARARRASRRSSSSAT